MRYMLCSQECKKDLSPKFLQDENVFTISWYKGSVVIFICWFLFKAKDEWHSYIQT